MNGVEKTDGLIKKWFTISDAEFLYEGYLFYVWKVKPELSVWL